MEAHFFRRLCVELAVHLTGARIEKFFEPAPDTTTIVIHRTGRKQNLLLQAGRRFPLLFLSDKRPVNPDNPSAKSMWLRKYAAGKRLGAPVVDWSNRRLAFPLTTTPTTWLVLDLCNGVSIAKEKPEWGGYEPEWCEPEDLPQVLASSDVWSKYPQLTPPLRKTLAALLHDDPMDAQALFVDLEYGYGVVATAEEVNELGEVYLYTKDGKPTDAYVWPLPESLLGKREEQRVATALEAATAIGEMRLFAELAQSQAAAAAKPVLAALKRTKKTLARLNQEKDRLERMIAGQQHAVLLQANLWQLDADSKLSSITLSVPEGIEGMAAGSSCTISLDPRKTIRENMAFMFKQARRGKRGMDMLAERRHVLEMQYARLKSGEEDAPKSQAIKPLTGGALKRQQKRQAKDKFIQRYRSSDGFLMLRGRNAQGNHEILNRVSSYDLWFHAEDGPSAHLVLHLDYPDQQIPEQTLQEAAILVGVKSWQREDEQARVMFARVKNVRKIKGAAAGKVRAEAEGSVLVKLNPELEETLKSSI
ncbi:NFACT RNA binding domain-containing protein [Halodesulfovibrio sp.]|jgi:predicted ribosome quality control (RQC) complex YloA/Tae2 family protein|uniref:NFACT RNA binding domain-containing protein n=1 Tax=Halodesulfovibrio sp. TaxID=1912772 RepID=UPI0025D80227|nr:NFACT RNA binding domain-containing protein [Halodesulfovibrio sp.]MCT4625896.1 NFACT RNA binding domain-containing protein [Halodesulfovibrio sp.]